MTLILGTEIVSPGQIAMLHLIRAIRCQTWIRIASVAFALAVGLQLRGADEPTAPVPVVMGAGQLDRLMAFGRLWGYVKYHHPRLGYGDIDWDDAFIQTVPAVLHATSTAEYRAAVDAMLARLDDPLTRTDTKESRPREPNEPTPFAIEPFGENTLLLRLGAAANGASGAFDALFHASAQLGQASALVFDLRGSNPGLAMNRLFEFSRLNSLIVPQDLATPGHRWRYHHGFLQQRTTPHGGYFSGFVTENGQHFVAQSGRKEIRCVFITDGGIPAVAQALQSAGRAAIIQIGPFDEGKWARTHSFPLTETLTATVRLSELVHSDGKVGFAPDALVDDQSQALDAARAWLRGGLPAPARFSRPAINRPEFDRYYSRPALPIPAHRLLAVFRAWSVIEYFFPYKELIGTDWTEMTRAALPEIANSTTESGYHLAMIRLLAQMNDSHINFSSQPYFDFIGFYHPPVFLRMIEGVPLVVSKLENAQTEVSVGDEIVSIDGQPWEKRYAELAQYHAASTPQSLDDTVSSRLLAGAKDTSASLAIRGAGGVERSVVIARTASTFGPPQSDRRGEAVRLLGPGIGYADLSKLTESDVGGMFERFCDTRALILDMRGYPSLSVGALTSRLATERGIPAARLGIPLITASASDGVHVENREWATQDVASPEGSRYSGRVVLLIDERAISASEHTGLHLKAAANAIFVGSPTAGANGNVTQFVLPGGIAVSFTGMEVRWPDGRQLQRVGLLPDVSSRPTIQGIREGRDEVLEAALRYLDGNEAAAPSPAAQPK